MTRSPSGGAVYQLRISLPDVAPPIWRRIRVVSRVSLRRLHYIVQVGMGWSDSHLHQFRAGQVIFGPPAPGSTIRNRSESRTRLDDVLQFPGSRLSYSYDFGDGWHHDILLERVEPRDPQGVYPHVISGKRACPPEDVGGPSGYARFLKILASPRHREHRRMREWCGGSFDPEKFDRVAVNLAFHRGWHLE
jgi:hypothetical protein